MATTRLDYRDPKQPRAVCVYTIAQESRYVIIENVPSLGVEKELVERCSVHGTVERHEHLDNHSSSTEYHDVYLIQYDTIQSARLAKRRMDDKPFYNQLLRVSYAPEHETIEDIRAKFQDRVKSVTDRLNALNKAPLHNKRKEETNEIKQDSVADTKKRRRI